MYPIEQSKQWHMVVVSAVLNGEIEYQRTERRSDEEEAGEQESYVTVEQSHVR